MINGKDYSKTIEWLLEGDPSVRYFTKRDILNSPVAQVKAEQQNMCSEGWCSKLLSLQDESGTWGNGLYTPKWISTTYTLLLLKRLGLKPADERALKACSIIAEKGIREKGGINYGWKSYPNGEVCVTGMTLSFLVYFKYPDKKKLKTLVEYLLQEQMPDGGWNCQNFRRATHSSFHTTISVLEGLWEYEKTIKEKSLTKVSREKAHNFLFDHSLYKSHRTGEIVHQQMVRLNFPPRWHYDILRAMDYFCDADTPYNKGMEEALKLIISKEKNGKWILPQKYSGKVFFDLEKAGKPSRVNTCRAIRVSKKYAGFI